MKKITFFKNVLIVEKKENTAEVKKINFSSFKKMLGVY